MPAGDLLADERASVVQDDLRKQIATLLLDRLEIITTDTVTIFPYTGVEPDADYCRRVGHQLAQLLAFAVRDGRIDPRRISLPTCTARLLTARRSSGSYIRVFDERTMLDGWR
jgi:hypothetical protein